MAQTRIQAPRYLVPRTSAPAEFPPPRRRWPRCIPAAFSSGPDHSAKRSLMRDRLMAVLVSIRVLAGLLSVLGLYGVIAYMVARRRNEMACASRWAPAAQCGSVGPKEVAPPPGSDWRWASARAMGGPGSHRDALRFEALRSRNTGRSDRAAGHGGVGRELRSGAPRLASGADGRVAGRVTEYVVSEVRSRIARSLAYARGSDRSRDR